MSVVARTWARTGFRRGPLSRRIDRIEAWSHLALLVSFVMITLPAAWSVGEAVNQAGALQERAQRFDRHQVTARLVQDAQVPSAATRELVRYTPATAEWSEPDGSTHRGTIQAVAGARAGSLQTIWTDRSGSPVPAPLTRSDTLASTSGAVFLVTVLTGSATAGAVGMLRRRFARCRLEQWEQEWQRVEPTWSRHR